MSETVDSAVVISLDGVGARYLGCYGNTSLATPALDRLASQSLLFETSLARIASSNPATWGWDRLQPGTSDGTQTLRVLTDDDAVAHWAESFADSVELLRLEENDEPARELADTSQMQFFEYVTERAIEIRPRETLIAHSRGFFRPWDAPYRMREDLCGEGDPPPPTEVILKRKYPGNALTPDEVLGWQQAYGAQLRVVDECMDFLMRTLDGSDIPSGRPVICFTSPRAFPIGEHDITGADADCLYDDALHVPLMIRDPRVLSGRRALQLVYADSWIEVLANLLGGQRPVALSLLPDRLRECLVCRGEGEGLAMRTHSWKFLQTGDRKLLFFKPDDRWEMNNIADRCPEVITQFDELLALGEQAMQGLPPLLAYGVD